MKAYHVHVVDGEFATIVFAESAREAKKLAMGTECCEDAAYIDIRVRREPIADQLYDGDYIPDIWAEVNKLSEEIKERRVSVADLRHTLLEEYGINV